MPLIETSMCPETANNQAQSTRKTSQAIHQFAHSPAVALQQLAPSRYSHSRTRTSGPRRSVKEICEGVEGVGFPFYSQCSGRTAPAKLWRVDLWILPSYTEYHPPIIRTQKRGPLTVHMPDDLAYPTSHISSPVDLQPRTALKTLLDSRVIVIEQVRQSPVPPRAVKPMSVTVRHRF